MNERKLVESKKVFDLTVQGKEIKEIAETLDISESSVSRIKTTDEYRTIRDNFNQLFISQAIIEHRKQIGKVQSFIPTVISNLMTLSQSPNEKIALDANKFLFEKYNKLVEDIVITSMEGMMEQLQSKDTE